MMPGATVARGVGQAGPVSPSTETEDGRDGTWSRRVGTFVAVDPSTLTALGILAALLRETAT